MMITDRAAIESVLHASADAWAAGDGKAYGACFTSDASYVTWVGTPYHGRDEIAASHQALFAQFLKGTKLAVDIAEIRFYGPDTAVVSTTGDVYKGARPAPEKFSKTQTYTVVREADGQWRIAAFHNTKRKRIMEAISFKFAPKTAPQPR
ncbi:SgcJ/EcaC family oxidoreductase [Hamadaea sp. NPDC051192]|uniref:SgcJ/EcaC family oxidoreductase n=1 Tax=Hamadaea sp. NPDC051192 TaxID=3154940 RepID=UPI003435CA9C